MDGWALLAERSPSLLPSSSMDQGARISDDLALAIAVILVWAAGRSIYAGRETDACDITGFNLESVKRAAEVNTILFVLMAFVGQGLHGVLKWTQGEAESPVAWFTSNIKATIGAIIANIGITITAIQLLPIDTMTAWASLYAGLLCGLDRIRSTRARCPVDARATSGVETMNRSQQSGRYLLTGLAAIGAVLGFFLYAKREGKKEEQAAETEKA